MSAAVYFTAAAAASYAALLLAKAWLALRAATRHTPPPSTPGAADMARVTVAQPILSGDPGLPSVLADNLETLPGVRFAWLVDTDDPNAQAICRDLARRFPGARITLLPCTPPPAGINPKLWKLEAARREAGEEGVLVVLDDDTRLPAASLGALLAGLGSAGPDAPTTGPIVATGLPAYLDDGRWPSRLLAQFVDDNAALTYLPLLNFRPPPTLNGMCYAIRTADLARLGGFAPLFGHLTDDLAVARRVLGAGGTIRQTASPQWIATTVRDGRHYLQLMHRWFLFATLLLRRQPPAFGLALALVHGLPPLLLWAVLAGAAVSFHPASAALALGLLALRAVTLVAVQRQIYGRSLHAPLASVAAELAQPFHLAHALLRRRIRWRTRHYRVVDDTDFRPLP